MSAPLHDQMHYWLCASVDRMKQFLAGAVSEDTRFGQEILNREAAILIRRLIQRFPGCMTELGEMLAGDTSYHFGLCPTCRKVERNGAELCPLCEAEENQDNKDEIQKGIDEGWLPPDFDQNPGFDRENDNA